MLDKFLRPFLLQPQLLFVIYIFIYIASNKLFLLLYRYRLAFISRKIRDPSKFIELKMIKKSVLDCVARHG